MIYCIYRKYTDLHSFWFYQRIDSQRFVNLWYIDTIHSPPRTSSSRRCETHGRDGGTSRGSGTRLPAAGGKLASTLAPSDASNGGELRFKISDCREIMHFLKQCPEFKECKHEMFMWFQVDIGSCSCCFCSLFLFTFFLVFFPLLFLLLVWFILRISQVQHLMLAMHDVWSLVLHLKLPPGTGNHHFLSWGRQPCSYDWSRCNALVARPYQNFILKSGEKWWLCCVFFHLQDFADFFSSNLNQKLEVTLLIPFTMCVRQTCWCFLFLHRLLRSCELTPEATGNIVSSIFEEARLE